MVISEVKAMRLIVTGGGTGGHIYPALAIADKFKEMDPRTEILYIGNADGIEKDVVPKSGYPLELIDAMWIEKKTPRQLIYTGAKVSHGIAQALAIMKRFRPDAVVGTGGYACFPVLTAARMIRCHRYLTSRTPFRPGQQDAGKACRQHLPRLCRGGPLF